MSTTAPTANKWIKRTPITLLVTAIILTLSIRVIPPLSINFPSVFLHESSSSAQIGLEADAARYTAMAEHFLGQKASIQAGLESDTARYTAMAEYYTGQSVLAGIEADAARYTAMAKYYNEKKAARIERSLDADAARYTAMAAFYTRWWENLQRTREADAARYTAMAKYYMSK
jgi:hypothetical protein